MIKSSELWVRDFWSVAEEGCDNLRSVGVVDILPLASPTTIFATRGAQGRFYGCAWEITDHSLAMIVASTPGLLEKVHEWQAVHRCNLWCDGGLPGKVCMPIPRPFAVLMIERAMNLWCFPIFTSN